MAKRQIYLHDQIALFAKKPEKLEQQTNQIGLSSEETPPADVAVLNEGHEGPNQEEEIPKAFIEESSNDPPTIETEIISTE